MEEWVKTFDESKVEKNHQARSGNFIGVTRV